MSERHNKSLVYQVQGAPPLVDRSIVIIDDPDVTGLSCNEDDVYPLDVSCRV
jgi:hypothetical protein